MKTYNDKTEQSRIKQIMRMIGKELDVAYDRGYFRGRAETRDEFLDDTAFRPPDLDETMEITIKIPKCFVSEWKRDRFKKSLFNLKLSTNHSYLVGGYEGELCEMLIEAFKNAREGQPYENN